MARGSVGTGFTGPSGITLFANIPFGPRSEIEASAVFINTIVSWAKKGVALPVRSSSSGQE